VFEHLVALAVRLPAASAMRPPESTSPYRSSESGPSAFHHVATFAPIGTAPVAGKPTFWFWHGKLPFDSPSKLLTISCQSMSQACTKGAHDAGYSDHPVSQICAAKT
jgi:hypothetical protein